MDLNYGVPQGSVLGPSLFSIHFDGVSSSIKLSNCTLYADDTELHASDCTAASAAASVNCDLVNIDKWLSSNHMVPNPDKSLVMKIGSIPALKSSEAIDVCLRNQRLKDIRRNKDIQGNVVDNEEIKLEIFADDLTSFLRDGASLNALLGTIECFTLHVFWPKKI